jgi:uncharacterized protein YbjT (DUF2867 family)
MDDCVILKQLTLLTGATGYIGGRLLEELESAGVNVRCVARKPQHVLSRVASTTEVFPGDAFDYQSMCQCMRGVHTAYYLIHSMGSDSNFAEEDRLAARNFAKAAMENSVERIIYVGGLGDASDELSPHLKSRQEVAEYLRSSGIQVFEFRASIVIGSGSLSFEMIRSLVERLPIMVTPKWVSVLAQPIAINDLIDFLVLARNTSIEGNQIFEIGGADRVSYGDIMKEYARQRGLKRSMIKVPFLSPGLSSLWLGLVTPVYARVGRKLIDSICHETVVKDPKANELFGVNPMSMSEAIAEAISLEEKDFAGSRWSDSVSSAGNQKSWAGVKFGTRMVDSRKRTTSASASSVFRTVQEIGGDVGWYYANWLWWLRGFIDLLVGGVGMRRGRRHRSEIRIGDTIDFWRVEAFEPMKRLRLKAEMKIPGRAWLEFEVSVQDGQTVLRQTAMFDPHGLLGQAYWYSLFPLHQIIFEGMLRKIVSTAEERILAGGQDNS